MDGREIAVPKTMPDPLTGKPMPTTMIQACALSKVDVPHYCYHPKLPVVGNCRMCLVEFGTPAMGPDRKPVMNPDGTPKIAKSPRPAIACATPISPGMEIYTTTPGVKQMREGVLEFLLINHPLLIARFATRRANASCRNIPWIMGRRRAASWNQKFTSPSTLISGRALCSMTSALHSLARAAFVFRATSQATTRWASAVNRGSYNTLSAYPGKAF